MCFSSITLASSSTNLVQQIEDTGSTYSLEFPDTEDSFNYVAVEEIIITSNEELISYASEGSGVKEDPYIIRDYAIYGLGRTYAMHITNVSVHFTIEHCRILSIYGIVIQNIKNVQINITNNIISQFDAFYQLDMLTAVQLMNCDNIIISKNNIESKLRGLDISYCTNVSIFENVIDGRTSPENPGTNFSGIALRESLNCSILSNTFSRGGIQLELSMEKLQLLSIENNTLNGLEIGYFISMSNSIISSPLYSQVILVNCTNMVIRNQNIENTFCGIFSIYCTNCRFSNNSIENGNVALECRYSINIIIENNFYSGNNKGIVLKECDSTKINGNQCVDSFDSIGIENSESTNTQLLNNNCSNLMSGTGILDFGDNSTFNNNICSYNSYGIILVANSNCKIYNNTISYNDQEGLRVNSGQKMSISYNLFLENNYFAIVLLPGSRDCMIHHNSFINNMIRYQEFSQAQDEGMNNYWYHPDTLVGNYWNDRGIKRKYEIYGSAGSYDLYPLKEPVILPDENYTFKTSFPQYLLITTIIILYSIRKKFTRRI